MDNMLKVSVINKSNDRVLFERVLTKVDLCSFPFSSIIDSFMILYKPLEVQVNFSFDEI